VLDPFSGTFTTSFVAKQLRRKSIGIEIQEEYVKTGLRRLRIMSEYNGLPLQKERRSFEPHIDERQITLNLLEE
jgi:site-specific DNA-methyltransferase (adenine-specific)